MGLKQYVQLERYVNLPALEARLQTPLDSILKHKSKQPIHADIKILDKI